MSKNYTAIKDKIGTGTHTLESAVAILKEHVKGKFDQTVEMHVNLGVDASKSDQMVRGSVTLPHGTPKQPKILVISADTKKLTAAKEAGASQVGGEEVVEEIVKSGGIAVDMVIATPDMMPKIAKAAKVLGPKGLMPNPKTGTVTADPALTVREAAGGKISFKMDATGNIHEAIAKVSWDTDKIVNNAKALLAAIRSARPASQKGEYIKKVVVKSTMSPGIVVV